MNSVPNEKQGSQAPTFGGLGGISGGRPLDPSDEFEAAVNRCLGNTIRSDDDAAQLMWSALANVDWKRMCDGATASYSFRAAGDLVAAIRGNGNYLDWYCGSEYAMVADFIAEAMKSEGWIPEALE